MMLLGINDISAPSWSPVSFFAEVAFLLQPALLGIFVLYVIMQTLRRDVLKAYSRKQRREDALGDAARRAPRPPKGPPARLLQV